jgi:hypothetical protein
MRLASIPRVNSSTDSITSRHDESAEPTTEPNSGERNFYEFARFCAPLSVTLVFAKLNTPPMDRIEELRRDIAKHIDRDAMIPEGCGETLSPSGQYRMTIKPYRTMNTNRNWNVAEIEISDVATSGVLHRYNRGDDRCFYAWVTKGSDEFLLLSEDLEGQSIYSPTLRRFESVAPEDDAFIWCVFHPSPSGRYLAVEGCYRACPYMVIIYDFTDPMNLPLPKILECDDGHNVEFDCWLSDTSFLLKSPFRGELTLTS